MKANKASEKIYLDSYGSGFSHGFHTNKLNDNDIEYTRTDAFIKKAEEFLYEKLNSGEMECGDIVVFIEKFRNCMKG